MQAEALESVISILGCSPSTARLLLMHFRWDSDLLFGASCRCMLQVCVVLCMHRCDFLGFALDSILVSCDDGSRTWSAGALAERGTEFIYRLARVTPKTDETPAQPSGAPRFPHNGAIEMLKIEQQTTSFIVCSCIAMFCNVIPTPRHVFQNLTCFLHR